MPSLSEAETPIAPKRSRKLARELAFQALYTVDMREGDVAGVVEDTLERVPLAPASERFFRALVGGVTENQLSLDSVIVPCLTSGWGLDRLAITDLAALRLGVFELEHLPGMPPKVSISEAVELATRYGSVSSGRFVNGVLSTVLKQSSKLHWDPSQEDQPEPEDEYVPEVEVDEV
ncbi:MAG: transcription antitermination factor NusB, partial [Armatimonadota bacterium]